MHPGSSITDNAHRLHIGRKETFPHRMSSWGDSRVRDRNVFERALDAEDVTIQVGEVKGRSAS